MDSVEDNLDLKMHDKNVSTVDSLLADEKLYKEKQKERMAKYVVNGTDTIGYKIEKVLAKGDEYAIYEVADIPAQESIRVYIDTIREGDMKPIDCANKIKPHFDEFLSILFKYNCDVSYKKRASNAMAMAITGDIEGAISLFNKIKNDAQKEYKEKVLAKLSYQSGALFLAILFVFTSTLAYFFRETPIIQENLVFFHLLLAASFATLGGLLSMSLKINDLVVDKEMNKISYFIYGAQRITISVIGGVLIYIIIKGDLALGFLGSNNDQLYVIMTFCLLAGFSETLVPNTLKNLENMPER